jgi:MSHA pilin protein MshA
MKIFNKKQSGFTLVELVVVVAVVGVLAVVATPKIVGVANDARDAALTGVAGALTAASTRNYATRGADQDAGDSIKICKDVADALEGGLPTGYEWPTADIAAVEEAAATDTAVEVEARAPVYAGTKTINPEFKGTCTVSTETTPKRYMNFAAIGIE